MCMPREAQVWVHPNLRYMGGRYDRYTERAFFGGPWQDRVEQSIEAFDGDSIAITNMERDDGSVHFPDVNGPRSDIPYGRGMWDEIVEDADNGDLLEEHTDTMERWSTTYDHLTVRGGYLNVGDCLETFVAAYRAVDPDTPITVDLDNAYLPRGQIRAPLQEMNPVEAEKLRARVADRASDTPYVTRDVRAKLNTMDNVTLHPEHATV